MASGTSQIFVHDWTVGGAIQGYPSTFLTYSNGTTVLDPQYNSNLNVYTDTGEIVGNSDGAMLAPSIYSSAATFANAVSYMASLPNATGLQKELILANYVYDNWSGSTGTVYTNTLQGYALLGPVTRRRIRSDQTLRTSLYRGIRASQATCLVPPPPSEVMGYSRYN